MQNSFGNRIQQLEKQSKDEEKRSSDLLRAKVQQVSDQSQVTLEAQAKTTGEALTRLRKSDQDQINSLQKAMQEQKTSADTSILSPAAEESLRKTYQSGFKKTIQAEVTKNQLAQEESHQRFSTDYNKLREDYSDKETRINQQNANDRSYDRLSYFGSLKEVEDSSRNKLKEQSNLHERERELLLRQFSTITDRQRKEYERILQSSKSDAEMKLSTFQKEAEINSKNAQRAFALKQNELIRAYEDKLANQKVETEVIINNLKVDAQTELRELEKRNKQELDLQVKNFEQKFLQQETLNKERESTLSQVFQTETGKIKRNYELINQKKS